MFRRPPELLWIGIAAALFLWGILAGEVLTLIAAGSYLATQFLARAAVRLPLWGVFLAAAVIGAVWSASDGEIIDLIIWALLAVLAAYEINSDYAAARGSS